MKSRYTLPTCLFGVAVFALFLPSCEKKEPAGLPDPSSEESSSGTDDDANQIAFLGWSDFISPEAIAAFTKETGIQVDHTETESFDEVRAHLESSQGKYDVVIAESGNITEWINLKLIRKLDHAQLPLIENMDSRYLNFVTDPGNGYSIPVLSGTTLIAYNKEKYTPADESWSALWDPALKGKIALLDDPREVFAIGFKKNGYSLNSSDIAEFEKAESDLVALATGSGPRFEEPFTVLDLLADGEVWMAHCFSGDATVYAADHPNIGIFHPKEGSTQWVDAWAVPRDTKKVAQAHVFINYMMRPDAAALTSNFSRYRTPNKAALELLDADLREDPFVYPAADLLARCEILDPRDADREARLQLGMRKLVLASPRPVSIAEDITLLPVTGDPAEDEE